ncbi:SDR family NAD(P)-dependent oxidoreductase [uncultured Parolsenella sp.]|uniref:SDR family NAD(P)-dependent oxidoreductase n=1 Tax=uncultured Parolsenella sp. TaxID=2083008 RepID=UPI0025E44F7E|nr:SDR family NAD(P)-dependent oxidoreductase [uncultured Parolsenella sp.]
MTPQKGFAMRFEGKSVVVTGASAGMGRQIAYDFAKEGATVVAVARRAERLEQLAAEVAEAGLSGRVLPYVGDVSSRKANEGMVDFAVSQTGKLDILVNNAGIMDGFEPIADIADERWDQVFAVNVKGPMYAMRKAVQVMLEQETKGNIVNVASIGGTNGARAGVAYTASKHALVGMTENTGYMYANSGIRCNAVCPGGVETEIAGSMMAGSGINQFGMGRAMAGLDSDIRQAKPEELASVVLFIASDEASFMTGACVKVDGGVSVN